MIPLTVFTKIYGSMKEYKKYFYFSIGCYLYNLLSNRFPDDFISYFITHLIRKNIKLTNKIKKEYMNYDYSWSCFPMY